MRASAGKPPPPSRPGGTARPAAARTPQTCPGARSAPHGRQDLHHAGRQDLPPVAVRHADLPVLRPGRRGRSTRRPGSYDYDQAARDALAFAALFDRFIQNLRRYLGYDVQYFAAIEPQRRLAPHVHIAMRGTIARAEIRRVLAATYHQVWWPDTSTVKYDGDELPVWDEATGHYLDPATGEVLPGWDQALDELGDQPHHVARFGDQFNAHGVLAGLQGRRPVHRLPDQIPHQADRRLPPPRHRRAAGHAARLAEALRYQPCSPRCANWLRYGIQPKNARPGLVPGRCKGKAHDADHLGYAGRRVLVSRKWSGKTLADHRADRKEWLLEHARCFGN